MEPVRISIIGIDGSGKSTTTLKAIHPLSQQFSICRTGRNPFYILKGNISHCLPKTANIYYLSAVVLIIFLFLLLIVFHFSVVISRLSDWNKELAQRHALLELEFNEFKKLHLPPGTVGQWFVDHGRN
jgi:Uncharacterized conserved protein (DUF2304)